MSNHAQRVQRYSDRFGLETVENFIDKVLSLEEHIDIHGSQNRTSALNFREHGEKDILLFLLDHAPLETWQQDIVWIVREESFYFAPQRQTKIMNEGWASFWHSKILTEKALTENEFIDYADHHSATLLQQPQQLNPYKIGIELFKEIENQFEVRKTHNDITFLDTFLTPAFCEKNKLFVYQYNPRSGSYEITSRKFEDIKEKILFSMANFGRPFIYVADDNYGGKHDLLLKHDHHGVDLDIREAFDVLENIFSIWHRPVHLHTSVTGQKKLLSFDGSEQKERNIT